MVMASSVNLLTVFLGLELLSIPLYVLNAFLRRTAISLEAGLKYFVLGALSSGMLLYGASLIYGFAGSTDFQVIANAAKGEGVAGNLWLIFGLVFLLVGLAILFRLHHYADAWLLQHMPTWLVDLSVSI